MTAVCLTGTVATISQLIPLEAGIAIVVWIGVIITAQAFSKTPPHHGAAVAIGLFPALAAWGATISIGAFAAAGGDSVQQVLNHNPDAVVNGFFVHGMLLMERGFIFTCMILSAITALLIDRRFIAAAAWSLLGALLSGLGLTHAYQLKGNVLDYLLLGQVPANGALAHAAGTVAVGYLAFAAVFAPVAGISGRAGRRESTTIQRRDDPCLLACGGRGESGELAIRHAWRLKSRSVTVCRGHPERPHRRAGESGGDDNEC